MLVGVCLVLFNLSNEGVSMLKKFLSLVALCLALGSHVNAQNENVIALDFSNEEKSIASVQAMKESGMSNEEIAEKIVAAAEQAQLHPTVDTAVTWVKEHKVYVIGGLSLTALGVFLWKFDFPPFGTMEDGRNNVPNWFYGLHKAK